MPCGCRGGGNADFKGNSHGQIGPSKLNKTIMPNNISPSNKAVSLNAPNTTSSDADKRRIKKLQQEALMRSLGK